MALSSVKYSLSPGHATLKSFSVPKFTSFYLSSFYLSN